MSVMHSAYAIGAVAGPATIGLILRSSLRWQLLYRGLAGILAATAVLAMALPFPRISADRVRKSEPTVLRRRAMFYLGAALLFLYVGLEFGTSRWVGEYFVSVLHSPASLGAFMVSVFWTGLLIGRLSIPALFRRVEQAVLLLALSLMATASVALTILVRSPVVAGVGFFLAGLGCSAIFPLVMTIVGQYFRTEQGAAIGFAATGGAVGALVFPFAMAAVSGTVGLRYGFLLYVLLGLATTVVAAVVVPTVRRREREGS